MTNLSITDLAALSGLKQHTIRMWERRYALFQPKRGNALRRSYSLNELGILLDIILLRKHGHKISHIAKMSNIEMKNKIEIITPVQQELKAINELIICMAEMDAERFGQVLDDCVVCLGIHKTIEKIIVSFAEKVKLFDSPDELQYIENISLIREPIKEKIYFGLETELPGKSLKQTVLLFSLRARHESLMLFYLRYFLKSHGFKLLCPDILLTFKQLEIICCHKTPEWIILESVKTKDEIELNTFAINAARSVPQLRLITFGDKIHIPSLDSFHSHVSTLTEAIAIVNDGRESKKNG